MNDLCATFVTTKQKKAVNNSCLQDNICYNDSRYVHKDKMYKVLSTSIYGGSMEFDFDTLHEAQVKVRELKDNDHRSAFIVRLMTVNN